MSTMDEADKIIFGSSISDKLRSANRQQSPMLSPGRVRWAYTVKDSQAALHQSCLGCCLQMTMWPWACPQIARQLWRPAPMRCAGAI